MGLRVVDFGCGSGFMAVDFGLFCGGLWVNGGVARFCLGFMIAGLLDFAAMPPLFGWIVVVV